MWRTTCRRCVTMWIQMDLVITCDWHDSELQDRGNLQSMRSQTEGPSDLECSNSGRCEDNHIHDHQLKNVLICRCLIDTELITNNGSFQLHPCDRSLCYDITECMYRLSTESPRYGELTGGRKYLTDHDSLLQYSLSWHRDTSAKNRCRFVYSYLYCVLSVRIEQFVLYCTRT